MHYADNVQRLASELPGAEFLAVAPKPGNMAVVHCGLIHLLSRSLEAVHLTSIHRSLGEATLPVEDRLDGLLMPSTGPCADL